MELTSVCIWRDLDSNSMFCAIQGSFKSNFRFHFKIKLKKKIKAKKKNPKQCCPHSNDRWILPWPPPHVSLASANCRVPTRGALLLTQPVSLTSFCQLCLEREVSYPAGDTPNTFSDRKSYLSRPNMSIIPHQPKRRPNFIYEVKYTTKKPTQLPTTPIAEYELVNISGRNS